MWNTFNYSTNAYSVEKNTTFYQDISKEKRVDIILRYIGKWKKVLDVWCYNWEIAKIISDTWNEVYWLDASATWINAFNSRWINWKWMIWDLEWTFPFENETFDIIHAWEIIEHLYDTDTFIKECNRVLKKWWKIIVTTPNVVSLPRRILYLFWYWKFFEASNTFSTEKISVWHIRFFDKQLLINFLKHNWFELENFTSDYVNFPFFKSNFLAKIKPTFWRTLIWLFIKK